MLTKAVKVASSNSQEFLEPLKKSRRIDLTKNRMILLSHNMKRERADKWRERD